MPTLKELNVKPGDVVVQPGDISKEKFVASSVCEATNWVHFEGGDKWVYDGHVNWEMLTRASDTPKTWGDMTPEEKGALLLAEYERGNFALRYKTTPDDTWGEKHISDGFNHEWYYEVKPEPKRETVEVGGRVYFSKTYPDGVWDFGRTIREDDTARITFDAIDGKPDWTTLKGEDL